MTGIADAESRLADALRLVIVAAVALAAALPGLSALPPLDRDEARFAQATAQMLETGDFIAIRFQEDERNKKPAGIHWLQAASVAALSDVETREIWPYRLPSVAGAVLAALFTYLIGARLYGPGAGLLAAFLLSAAPAVAGEATIAKTDAFLLATVCAAQAAFAHLFAAARDSRPIPYGWLFLFWLSLGAGILIKGPIAPMIVGLTGVAMAARWPRLAWLRYFKPFLGLALLIVTVGPWALAIGLATEGRFFTEAIGGDMLGKVGAVQESHSGPPGYHFALLWILFWPAAALLAPGFRLAVATRRAWTTWFLAAWAVPSWLVFEMTATKLPHYAMPLYPALALLAARAACLGVAGRRQLVRRLGAGIYFVIGLIASAAIGLLPALLGDDALRPACFAAAGALAAGTLAVAWLFWKGRALAGAYAAAGLAILLAVAALEGALPRLQQLEVSPRLAAAIEEAGLHALRSGSPPTALAGFYEPSAVFLLGTGTVLTDGAGAARHLAAHPDAAAAVEARLEGEFKEALAADQTPVRRVAEIDGLNYSNGRRVRLTVYARQ